MVEQKFTKKKIIHDSDLEDVSKKYPKREISDSTWIVSIEELTKRGYDLSPKNPKKHAVQDLPESKELMKSISTSLKEAESILNKLKKII